MHDEIAIYVHWPFCVKKCPYCDFNSHVADKIDYNLWQKSYLAEIAYFAPLIKQKKISSIFFGGGTPSTMPSYIVADIIGSLQENFIFNDDIEITLEANPVSVEAKKFAAFKKAGINRISIGVQSFNDENLRFLGRAHNAKEALGAIDIARQNFSNYSFDLIYALPDQNINKWQKELDMAFKLSDKHLSLYQLTIEKGTEFFTSYKKKLFTIPNELQSKKLLEFTYDRLAEQGFVNYEISNFAKAGFESKHNLAYWRYKPYLGLGPGSHSRVNLLGKEDNISALMMWHAPSKWLQNIAQKQNAIQEQYVLSKKQIAIEILLMGLRLKEAIPLNRFNQLLQIDFDDIWQKDFINSLCKENLLLIEAKNMSVTPKGKLLLNSLVEKMSNKILVS